MRRAPFAALIFPVLLAACGTAIESPMTVFADPGKYEWYSCDQLIPQRKLWESKEKDLKLLMEKAKQGTGGSAISVVAYQGDYVNAREELQVIDATARANSREVRALGVQSRSVMESAMLILHCGRPYGTDSSRQRQDHARRPSCYTAIEGFDPRARQPLRS